MKSKTAVQLLWAMGYMLLLSILYGWAIHFPWHAPLVLHASSLDFTWPYEPSWVFIYATYFLLYPVLWIWRSKSTGFKIVFTSAIFDNLLNIGLNIAFPTSIANSIFLPRHFFLSFLQQFDTTLAALPSGHVSLPTAIATASFLVMRKSENRERGTWRVTALSFTAWTLMLGLSALFTKQHYFIDLGSGLVLGVFSAWAVPKLILLRWKIHVLSLLGLMFESILIVFAIGIAIRFSHWPIMVLAAFFIATRQHAMLVLYHDAVHGLIAKPRRLNDLIINTFLGVPLFLPVHMYRALHMSHHRDLGTSHDPERVLLYRDQLWNFRALETKSLLRQLFGDFCGYYGIRMTLRYFNKGRGPGNLQLPKTVWNFELVAQYLLFSLLLITAFRLFPHSTMLALLLWYVPFVTLTQGLQKIRSFAEHTTMEDHPSGTCSWNPGLLGRWILWPYNIHMHREHHSHSHIPWNELPRVPLVAPRRAGRELIYHLWRRV